VTAYDAAGNESGFSNTACATTSPSQSNGNAWNFTATTGSAIVDISLTANPTNRTFNISLTIVAGSPYVSYIWAFGQGSNQFTLSKLSWQIDNDTAFFTPNDGWDATSILYPGVTKSGVISQIPSWFNFNAPFTFVFNSQNSFLLSP
jgi:hypothetical protein